MTTPSQRKQWRQVADGFRGRFVFEPAHCKDNGHGHIADFVDVDDRLMYVPEDCELGDDECFCIADQLDEHVARPIAEMLNALPALLDEVERLEMQCSDMKSRLNPAPPAGMLLYMRSLAATGPVHVEDDGAFPGDRRNVYRIVRDEDSRRFREDYNTTARPPYVATVYSREDAEFYSICHNHVPTLVGMLEGRDTLRAENERLKRTLAQPHMEWAAGMHSVGVDIASEDKRIRAENEQLRPHDDEVDSVMSLLNWTRQHHDRDSSARVWLERIVASIVDDPRKAGGK